MAKGYYRSKGWSIQKALVYKLEREKFGDELPPDGKWHYVVIKGKMPGIYDSWSECKRQVDGYRGAIFKKFAHESAAMLSLRDGKFYPDTKLKYP
jgi:viroplasmin and RNaseH domain-containing protein